MRRVALLTESRFLGRSPSDDWYISQAVAEDALVTRAFAERGVQATAVDWLESHVSWSEFDAVLIRATWNYADHVARYHETLAAIHKATRLLNPYPLVAWNLDKHYLATLADAGIPVVPTRYAERGEDISLENVVAEMGWDEVCVKPVVSAGARHTYRVGRDALAGGRVSGLFSTLLASESMMVQPFQASVPRDGERTFVVMGGRCTHGVLKRPAPGDFRVQDDFGGSVAPHEVTAGERALVEATVAACPVPPVYARVDVVTDNDGRDALMELELVEPELFLRFDPSAALALVDAVLAQR